MERGRSQKFVKNCLKDQCQKFPTRCKKKVSKTKKICTKSYLYGQSLNDKIAYEPIIPHVHTLYCMEGIPIKMVRKSEPRRRDS